MSEDNNKEKGEPGFDLRWADLLNVLELFRRYFSEQATPRERNSVETWEPLLDESALLNDQHLDKECDTDSVWKAIVHELKFDRQPKKGLGRVLSYGRPYQRFAAAMLLFVFLGITAVYLVHRNSVNKSILAQTEVVFQTTNDQTRLLEFPDGTHIHLNRGTIIHYIQNAYNKKLREVWLEGEAFFDVAKNPDKPFIIHTGEMTTTVRGTSFNVKAYPQLKENVVSVCTGRVEVSDSKEVLALLTPNKQVVFNTSNGICSTMEVDATDVVAWKSGALVFQRAGVDEIRLRLMQQFHLEVEIHDHALNDENCLLSSTFPANVSLYEVLDVLEAAANVRCKVVSERKVVIEPSPSNP
jgi:transmembrane sensor